MHKRAAHYATSFGQTQRRGYAVLHMINVSPCVAENPVCRKITQILTSTIRYSKRAYMMVPLLALDSLFIGHS